MGELRIINPDGSKAVMAIPEGVQIDAQAMGMMPTESVTAFKMKVESESSAKARAEMQAKIDQIAAEKAAVEAQLGDFQASLTKKDSDRLAADTRIQTMEKTLTALQQSLEAQTKSAQQAQLAKEIADARSGLAFAVPDAIGIFDMQVASKRQADGSYLLATGVTGTIDQLRDEWTASPLGKSLLRSNQRPGAGTTPGIDGKSFSEIRKDPKLASAYVAQHGSQKFAEMVWAEKQTQIEAAKLAKMQGYRR